MKHPVQLAIQNAVVLQLEGIGYDVRQRMLDVAGPSLPVDETIRARPSSRLGAS